MKVTIMDTQSPAGGAGSFSFDDSHNSHLRNGHGRGRVQADDFGLPKVWDALGIGYTRFSDEGSNHRSLDQQLLNVLTKAQREGVFVPWEYVCADAAVSGTIACRRGYTVAKMLLEQSDALGISWFIVDDLTTPARPECVVSVAYDRRAAARQPRAPRGNAA